MKTDDIRRLQKISLERVKNSVKYYMEWNTGGVENIYSSDIRELDKDAWEFYDKYVTQCVVDDINRLRDSIMCTHGQCLKCLSTFTDDMCIKCGQLYE